DEYDWLKPDIRPNAGPLSQDFVSPRLLPQVTTAERSAWQTRETKIKQEMAALAATLERETRTTTVRIQVQRWGEIPELVRSAVRTALTDAPDKRESALRGLLEQYGKRLKIDRAELRTLDAKFKASAEGIERQLQALAAEKRPEPLIQ